MERWDIYDIERKKTGKTMVRGTAIPPEGYHLVVHVCIFNSEGKMLIQQRQPFKEGWSNLWDLTVGGSAVEGDNSQRAAQREVKEEIGLELDFEGVQPHLTIHDDQGFDDIYILEKDVQLEELTLQYEEVQNVKWASKEEIIELIENGEFIPYYPTFISLLFEMKGNHGNRRLSTQHKK